MQTEIEMEEPKPSFAELIANAPKKPRQTKKITKVITPAMRMLEAVNFIMPAQKKTGPIEYRYTQVINGWIIACTDNLLIGHPIEGMLDCCPSSEKLKSSLAKCVEDINITSISGDAISIMSGDFKAVVPCVSSDKFYLHYPDEQVGPCSDALKEAINSIYEIAENKSPDEIKVSVLIQDQSCICTDGKIILEAYHGHHMPDDIVISKESAKAIAKSKATMTGFGFSQHSITFYFENGAFIKARRLDFSYRKLDFILAEPKGPTWTVPNNFLNAIKTIAPFSSDEFVHFKEGLITSDTEENEASTFKMETLHTGISVNIKNLIAVRNVFQNVKSEGKRITFNLDKVRGAMSVSITEELENEII